MGCKKLINALIICFNRLIQCLDLGNTIGNTHSCDFE
jgi:hypothetical protein